MQFKWQKNDWKNITLKMCSTKNNNLNNENEIQNKITLKMLTQYQ